MGGVFLSYAREDSRFVSRLHNALADAGKDPAWDQDHSVIPFGSMYRAEIASAITASDKFIFVISPDSLDSAPCAEELAAAGAQAKEIVPLLRRPARDGQPIPEAIAERNWIFFDDDSDDAFGRAFGQLIETLDTDLDYVKMHTQLAVRAREWAASGSDRGGLLRGSDLRAAEAWLAAADAHPTTLPTSAQRVFIATSRRAADRAVRRQRSALAAGLAIALVLATFSLVSRAQAISERNLAVYNQTLSEAMQEKSANTSLAADLYLAAYHMRTTPDVESDLISSEGAPLSSTPNGEKGFVYSAALSHDGDILATMTNNGIAQLWSMADPAHPRLARTLTKGQPGLCLCSVAFSPTGRILVVKLSENWFKLWDVSNLARPTSLATMSISGTGTAMAFNVQGTMLAIGNDIGDVMLWNISNPAKPILENSDFRYQTTGVTNNYVTACAFSRDGGTLFMGFTDNKIRLWNVTNPRRPHEIGVPVPDGTQDAVPALAVSPDGKTLAAGSYGPVVPGAPANGIVSMWNIAGVGRPKLLTPPTIAGYDGAVRSLSFSADGTTLATGEQDGAIQLWNASDPADLSELGKSLLAGSVHSVFSVAFTPDGRGLVSADGTLRYWSFPHALLINPHPTTAVAFDRARRLLLAASADGTIRVWSLADPQRPEVIGQPVNAGPYPTVLLPTSDGKTLVTGSGSGIYLWDLANPGRPTPVSHPLPAGLTRYLVALSPNGRILAVSDTIAIQLWSITDPRHPAKLGRPKTISFRNGLATDIAFSPDGRFLAAGGEAGDIAVWTVDSATGAVRPFGRPWQLPGLSGISAIAFSPDSRALAVGTSAATISLWNVNSPRIPSLGPPLTAGGSGGVFSLAFSHDGRTLASGHLDGDVRLWDVADPAAATALGGTLTASGGTTNSVAFSDDGRMLATANNDGTVHLYYLDVQLAIQRICSISGNALTPGQWATFIPELPYRAPCRR